MTLIIVLLGFLAVFFLVKGWVNKYSFLAVGMMLSMILFILSSMLIVNVLDYSHIRFIYNEKYFLNVVKQSLNHFSIVRIFNISIALYMISLVSFVSAYFKNTFEKFTLKKLFNKTCIFIIPVLYVVFYDKQTTWYFYNQILSGHLSYTIIAVIDVIFYIVLIVYSLWAFVYVLIKRRQITLKYKKRQIFGVGLFTLSLDGIFFLVYTFLNARGFYFAEKKENLLRVTRISTLNEKEYFVLLFAMLIVITVFFIAIFKFDIAPKRGFLVRYVFAKNMQKTNKNFLNIFHSVKKTIFMYKILVEKALNSDDEESKQTLIQLREEMDKYISRLSEMQGINNDPEIFMEKVKISDVIDEILQNYKMKDSNVKIKKTECDNAVIEADSFYLCDALDNLIKNSVEAIQRKGNLGSVLISANCEHEWVVVRIKDDGEGIEKKNLKNIFKPFVTTKSRLTNWGLGLPYTMKIIKIHLGRMYIESTFGEGTTITVLLPRIA